MFFQSGASSLMIASQCGKLQVVQVLLRFHARVDVFDEVTFFLHKCGNSASIHVMFMLYSPKILALSTTSAYYNCDNLSNQSFRSLCPMRWVNEWLWKDRLNCACLGFCLCQTFVYLRVVCIFWTKPIRIVNLTDPNEAIERNEDLRYEIA